ncbi:MAG: hypothetical protein V1492_02300 [Candidatus Micrarchaeota archaeon]
MIIQLRREPIKPARVDGVESKERGKLQKVFDEHLYKPLKDTVLSGVKLNAKTVIFGFDTCAYHSIEVRLEYPDNAISLISLAAGGYRDQPEVRTIISFGKTPDYDTLANPSYGKNPTMVLKPTVDETLEILFKAKETMGFMQGTEGNYFEATNRVRVETESRYTNQVYNGVWIDASKLPMTVSLTIGNLTRTYEIVN